MPKEYGKGGTKSEMAYLNMVKGYGGHTLAKDHSAHTGMKDKYMPTMAGKKSKMPRMKKGNSYS